MSKPRTHFRVSRPGVEVESPLIDCRLLNLSTSGLAIETTTGLRLGVPYPFRLRDGEQTISTEAEVRWCRLVRNEVVEGELRPIYRAGAAFVEWQSMTADGPANAFEEEIEATLDEWIDQSRMKDQDPTSERTIIRHVPGWGRQ
jgi:hypothetical protein